MLAHFLIHGKAYDGLWRSAMLDGVASGKKGALSGQLRCVKRISCAKIAYSLAGIRTAEATTKAPDKTFT